MSNLQYAILGTGGIGGFYGGRLQKAGCDVHFLLHQDYTHVSQHGLIIDSYQGDFTLPIVKAYNDVEKMPQCDVVIVALKTTENYLLPKFLPSVVKDNGIVILFQNGLGVETEIASIIDHKRIIGGVCFICSYKIGPGHIRHLDYGNIELGQYENGYQQCQINKKIYEVARDFERSGIKVELVEDLLLARWKKLIWNIPFNGLSVVLKATTDEMTRDTYTLALAEELMREVVAGAKSCDRLIPDSYIKNRLEFTINMKPYHPSMKIDYDQKRPLEIEAIFGNPLRMARSAGVELPKIAMLYQQLKFLDAKNRGLNNYPDYLSSI